jgi:hypothetical protein
MNENDIQRQLGNQGITEDVGKREGQREGMKKKKKVEES